MATAKVSGSEPAEGRQIVLTLGDERTGTLLLQVVHALRAFLGISLALVAGFVVLGLLLYGLERAAADPLEPVRAALSRHLFASSDVTGSVLDTVAGGFLTMTSIIITMLLLVLQQTAGNMGNLIFDQFMARRRNKLYTGLIVGTLVLALMVRSTVSDLFNPVLGATVVLAVSLVSIVLLPAFLYTVIEQMRPELIISDIHQSTLEARKRQATLLLRTRERPESTGEHAVDLRSEADGYVVRLDLERLAGALAGADASVEVLLVAAPGVFVSYYDLLAEVRAADPVEARRIAERIGPAFRFASKREMEQDPSYGLEQLEMLAWTDISSAKQNPEVGVRAIHSLRDLLSRWLMQDVAVEGGEPLPVVYTDTLLAGGLDVLESMGVAAFESKQHQVLAEVLRTVSLLLGRLSPELRERAEELVLRFLPHLEEQILSRELDLALVQVAAVIDRLGDGAAARAVHGARQEQPGAVDLAAAVLEAPHKGALSAVREPSLRGERS